MKQLFEAEIPHYCIAEIMQISRATVAKDVARVEKQFGIRIKTPKSPYQLYASMLKVYAEGFQVEEKTPLWKCAEKILEVEKLHLAMRGSIELWERLKFPSPYYQISFYFLPYVDLLRALYGDNFLGIHPKGIDEVLEDYTRRFWKAVAKGEVPNRKSVHSVEDGIEVFAEWMSRQSREELTTLSLKEESIVGAFQEIFEECLSPEEIRLLQMRFGIQQAEKQSLKRIAILWGVDDKRANYLINRAIKKLKESLYQKLDPYLKSQGKITLQQEKIKGLESEKNERLALLKRRGEEAVPTESRSTESTERSEREELIKFLTTNLWKSNLFSVRTANSLKSTDSDYIYQLCEPGHWRQIVEKKIRNFGKKCLEEVLHVFEVHHCIPKNIDKETLRICEEMVLMK
ncbi:MAG: hypothetical protein LBO09_09490 [Candidatus Peribacteria bacterium]|nr:hypothetical protein [Candidatus Peribacteria bacterium]